jgi:hypothetical protein
MPVPLGAGNRQIRLAQPRLGPCRPRSATDFRLFLLRQREDCVNTLFAATDGQELEGQLALLTELLRKRVGAVPDRRP